MKKRGIKNGTKYTVPVTNVFAELIYVMGGPKQVAADVNTSTATLYKSMREKRVSYSLLVRISVKYNISVTRLIDSAVFNDEVTKELKEVEKT